MSVHPDEIQQWLSILIAKAMNDALTFGLSDDLGGSVIHLDSSIPRHLNLSITNTLPANVQIVGQPGPASKSNHHFHIQFVNNQCLFDDTLKHQSDWHMKAESDEDGYVTGIYLLSNNTITLSGVPLPATTTSVQLRYSGAKLKNTADEVLQVAVTVGQNVYLLLGSKVEPVTGTETKHLITFADAGAPTPLIAKLVQPKTILNDGTPRDLLLRLVNTSPDPVTFTPPPDAGSSTPTAIQLSVDLNDTAAWALCKSGEVSSIEVTPPPDWNEEHAGKSGTGQKSWLFRPDYSKTTQIAAHTALEFSIKGVKTTLPPGFTNLYVTLQEFPNYGTQSVVTQIEKSPLVYNKDLNSGLLSQGTTGTNQALTLKGNTTGDLMLVEQSGAGSSANFKGGAGVNIDNLVLSGDARLSDHNVWFRSNPDKNNGIGWYGSGKPFANTNVNGPVTFGFEGGALGSTDGGERIALSWKQTGNVGIGTSEPKSALSVKGGVAVGSSYADTQAAPANTLLVEGSAGIGIGANELQSQFQVRSSNGIRLGLEGSGGGQLFIGANNDKSVQLVAIDPSEKNKAASFMYLGGPYDAPLPKLLLNAKEVDVQTGVDGNIRIDAGTLNFQAPVTSVNGTINIESLIVRGELDVYGRGLYVNGPLHVGGDDKAAIYLRRTADTYWKLSFDGVGDREAWAIWTTSDGRLKKEQRPIQDALSKVLRLRGMLFGWNEEGLQKFTRGIDEHVSAGPKATEEQHEAARNQERQRIREELAGDRIGLVAQDVEKVVPEVVDHDDEGYKQVRYQDLVALLVEAIKEQAAQIEALSRQVSALTEKVAD